VSVTIKEHRSSPVYVLGEVNRPGTYQLTHFMRLVDLLTLAGGFTTGAGESCAITRTGANGQTSRLEIDLRQLLEQGDMAMNIPVESGDMIVVAKKVERMFFILGDVGKPGAYPFPSPKGIHLSEALSTAGGFNKTANTSKSYWVRIQPDGSRQLTAVDLKKILAGQQEDPLLGNYDLVYVPDSKTKTLGYSFLNSLTTFAYGGFFALLP
jgi:polysaccharide export outer membrane protein